jgi:hypothetical protein
MTAVSPMSGKVQMAIWVEEVTAAALRQAAARRKVKVGEVIDALVEYLTPAPAPAKRQRTKPRQAAA